MKSTRQLITLFALRFNFTSLYLPTLAEGNFQAMRHQAHAKPGGPFQFADWDGNGKEEVTFDASDSHSHYFDGLLRQ